MNDNAAQTCKTKKYGVRVGSIRNEKIFFRPTKLERQRLHCRDKATAIACEHKISLPLTNRIK
jgi:hypothetical protein